MSGEDMSWIPSDDSAIIALLNHWRARRDVPVANAPVAKEKQQHIHGQFSAIAGPATFSGTVKRYAPGTVVKADDVRALGHVLQADHNATKGIVSTTSEFAPKLREDPFIKPYLPHRIELLDRTDLIQRFKDWGKIDQSNG